MTLRSTPALVGERLYALMREHGSAYVLVDRYERTADVEALEQMAAQAGATWFALTDELFKPAPERAPALLQLLHDRLGDAELLDRSIELAFGELERGGALRCVCGWLFLPDDVPRTRSAMSRRLDAHYPGQRIYLRYFDPRVLPQLVRLLGPQAGADLLAPVTTWCLLARDGEWCRFDTPASTLPGPSLHFDAMASMAIDRIQRVNEAADELARWGLDAGHERDEALDRALQEAARLGLSEAQDQVCYAAFACAHGPRFTAHPQLPRWLALARQAGLPLGAVLADHTTSITGTEETTS